MPREPWILSTDELAAALDAMHPVVAAFARRDAARIAEWSSSAPPRPSRRCRRRRALLVIPA